MSSAQLLNSFKPVADIGKISDEESINISSDENHNLSLFTYLDLPESNSTVKIDRFVKSEAIEDSFLSEKDLTDVIARCSMLMNFPKTKHQVDANLLEYSEKWVKEVSSTFPQLKGDFKLSPSPSEIFSNLSNLRHPSSIVASYCDILINGLSPKSSIHSVVAHILNHTLYVKQVQSENTKKIEAFETEEKQRHHDYLFEHQEDKTFKRKAMEKISDLSFSPLNSLVIAPTLNTCFEYASAFASAYKQTDELITNILSTPSGPETLNRPEEIREALSGNRSEECAIGISLKKKKLQFFYDNEIIKNIDSIFVLISTPISIQQILEKYEKKLYADKKSRKEVESQKMGIFSSIEIAAIHDFYFLETQSLDNLMSVINSLNSDFSDFENIDFMRLKNRYSSQKSEFYRQMIILNSQKSDISESVLKKNYNLRGSIILNYQEFSALSKISKKATVLCQRTSDKSQKIEAFLTNLAKNDGNMEVVPRTLLVQNQSVCDEFLKENFEEGTYASIDFSIFDDSKLLPSIITKWRKRDIMWVVIDENVLFYLMPDLKIAERLVFCSVPKNPNFLTEIVNKAKIPKMSVAIFADKDEETQVQNLFGEIDSSIERIVKKLN